MMFNHLPGSVKGERREAAAEDGEFVSERIGWILFATPSARMDRFSGTSGMSARVPFFIAF